MKRTHAAVVVAVTACLGLAGCGSGGRPSVGQIQSALTSADSPSGGHVSPKAAKCIATKLHDDKKISDSTLNAMVQQKKDTKGSPSEAKAVVGDSLDCMKNSLKLPSMNGQG